MKYTLKEITAIFVPEKKQKKTFNEKIGAFSVIIDNLASTNLILDKARKLGLSVPKIGEVTPKLNHSTLTFFFDHKLDVDFIPTSLESKVRNLVPRFSAKNDKWKIIGKLREASEEKRSLRNLLGIRGRSLRELTLLKKQLNKGYKKSNLVDLITVPIKQKPCPCNSTYVEVSEHYVQIGTEFFKKNPNDIILFDGQII